MQEIYNNALLIYFWVYKTIARLESVRGSAKEHELLITMLITVLVNPIAGLVMIQHSINEIVDQKNTRVM